MKKWMRVAALSFAFFPVGIRAHEAADEFGPLTRSDVSKILSEMRAARMARKSADRQLLFDVHLHYSDIGEPPHQVFTPEQILELLEMSGVLRAFVSSAPNERTHQLYDRAPSRIVPEIMPYRTEKEDLRDWFKKPELVDMVEELLRKGAYPYKGIGEFHVHDTKNIDTPNVRRVVNLAAQYGLLLHPHTGPKSIAKLFSFNRNARILWAHAGAYSREPEPTPQEVGAIMDIYPNLLTEIAYRKGIAPDGKLDPAWRELFMRHSDRIMVGSDPFTIQRWQDFPKILDEMRGWLAQLPQPVAEKLAFRNAEKLFGPAIISHR